MQTPLPRSSWLDLTWSPAAPHPPAARVPSSPRSRGEGWGEGHPVIEDLKAKGVQQVTEHDGDELFEMANLFPRTTGLPMTVWVSPRGSARHDVRVKVNTSHGDQKNIANTAVVGVRPSPHVVAGHLPADDRQAVFEWISLNTAAIVEYWDGRIDTIELGRLLRPIPSRQSGGPSLP